MRPEAACIAGGGIATPGLALVGEEGPELMNIGRTGMIMPADKTREALGGVSINNTFTGPINSEVDIERAMIISANRLQNKMRRI